MVVAVGFDWDDGNREKCEKHGVSAEEIEQLFARPLMVFPDDDHSATERRFRAVGTTGGGRHVFLVFTLCERDAEHLIRPISARYMHRTGIAHYEAQNPDLPD